MLHSYFHPAGIATLCLLITLSYAFPSASRSNSVTSTAAGRNLFYKSFDDLNPNVIPSSPSVPGKANAVTLQPEWEVQCIRPSEATPRERVGDDCSAICTQIESSEGATSFKIYSEADGRLVRTHGKCRITLLAWEIGATDVFKPILIAQSIRRIVEQCSGLGLGGRTKVGPRGRFKLKVASWYGNHTDATS